MLGEGVYIIGYLRSHESKTYRALAFIHENKQQRTPFPLAITYGRTTDGRPLDSQVENAFNALRPVRDLGADIDIGSDILNAYPVAVIPAPLKSVWGLAHDIQRVSGVKTTALPKSFANVDGFLKTVQQQAKELAETNGDLSRAKIYTTELIKIDGRVRNVVERIMKSDVLLQYDLHEISQHLRRYKLFFRSEHETFNQLRKAIEEEEPKKFLELWDANVRSR